MAYAQPRQFALPNALLAPSDRLIAAAAPVGSASLAAVRKANAPTQGNATNPARARLVGQRVSAADVVSLCLALLCQTPATCGGMVAHSSLCVAALLLVHRLQHLNAPGPQTAALKCSWSTDCSACDCTLRLHRADVCRLAECACHLAVECDSGCCDYDAVPGFTNGTCAAMSVCLGT